MNIPTTAYIFPAFSHDFADNPARTMPGFNALFADHILLARNHVSKELIDPAAAKTENPPSEFEIQILTYIFSHCISEILSGEHDIQHLVSGYSMGIYAALCHAKSISFETGLHLIKSAYDCCRDDIGEMKWGMATIIGLTRPDIEKLTLNRLPHIEITNQNADISFVVSGPEIELTLLMDFAREEGALHVRNLGVSIPYHATVLRNAACSFSRKLKEHSIAPPVVPMISLIDGHRIDGIEGVQTELWKNLCTPLNWFNTMRKMVGLGVNQFVECGPSTGLIRNANFIEGDFRFLSPHTYYRKIIP